MKILAICTFALTGLIGIGTVDAGPRTHPVEVTLAFAADASAQDKHSIIVRQARKACSSRAVYPHTHLREERRCRSEFVAAAIARIDDDDLTALYLGRDAGNELLADR